MSGLNHVREKFWDFVHLEHFFALNHSGLLSRPYLHSKFSNYHPLTISGPANLLSLYINTSIAAPRNLEHSCAYSKQNKVIIAPVSQIPPPYHSEAQKVIISSSKYRYCTLTESLACCEKLPARPRNWQQSEPFPAAVHSYIFPNYAYASVAIE
jgi:hypothetical protein